MLSPLLLLPLSALLAASHSLQSDPAAEEILALERALTTAMHARDRARLDTLLADHYVLRSVPDIARETWIDNAVTLCWGTRSDISDARVQVQGDVAVASLVLTFYVDPLTCRPATLRSLITDIWMRHAGTWRLAVRHSAPAPGSGAGIAAQFGLVPEVPPVWDVTGELSFLATAGNASTRTVGFASQMLRESGRWRTRARASLLTSAADGVTRARTITANARQSTRLSPRAELFGRVEYARDRFAGIENRTTVEVGGAFPLQPRPRHRLTLDAGVGVTAEQRLDADDLRFAVATGTLAYAWRIAPGTDLRDDLAFSADLQSGRNWRATNALAISVVLTRLLSIKASQAVEYRHFPVPGFMRTDTRSAVSLVVGLQRR